jgi:hypothetical protein
VFTKGKAAGACRYFVAFSAEFEGALSYSAALCLGLGHSGRNVPIYR